MRRSLILLVLGLFGCGGSPAALRPVDGRAPLPCAEGSLLGELQMQYFGTGGFKIQWRDEALLTGPFFSNPSVWSILLGRPVTTELGRKRAAAVDVRDVQAILVGQAHYDHLADVPLLVPRLPPTAKIWLSRTGKFLLQAAGVEPGRLEELNQRAGNWRRPGEWIEVGRHFRFMALHSEHAPHFMGMKFLTGHLEAPLDHPPLKAGDWVEGQTLAFLIEVLDREPDGEPKTVFRIHYQDSASNPPLGFHPPLPGDFQGTDLAVLCVASHRQVSDYPEGLLADLQPRHVVLAHWENFFRPPDEPLQAVFGIDPEAFVDKLESGLPAGGDWTTPKPGAILRYEVCNRSVTAG